MKTGHNEELYHWLARLEDQPLSEIQIGLDRDFRDVFADPEYDDRLIPASPRFDYQTPSPR